MCIPGLSAAMQNAADEKLLTSVPAVVPMTDRDHTQPRAEVLSRRILPVGDGHDPARSRTVIAVR